MRAISKGKDLCIHVIAEPGDGTHYDYFVYPDYDTYHFMPGVSSIRYPQTLDWWEIRCISKVEDCIPLAEREHCNPWTILECISCIKVLKGPAYDREQ